MSDILIEFGNDPQNESESYSNLNDQELILNDSNESIDSDEDKDLKVRLDKWLWAARFFKTRALARAAVEQGRVYYNGQKSKPSREIQLGSEVTIKNGKFEKDVIIVGLSTRRRSTEEAQGLFEEKQQPQITHYHKEQTSNNFYGNRYCDDPRPYKSDYQRNYKPSSTNRGVYNKAKKNLNSFYGAPPYKNENRYHRNDFNNDSQPLEHYNQDNDGNIGNSNRAQNGPKKFNKPKLDQTKSRKTVRFLRRSYNKDENTRNSFDDKPIIIRTDSFNNE